MKNIMKIIKNNFFGFVLGIILASSIGVYAATTLASSSVAYDNSTSGGSSTNVKGALDELYDKASYTEFKVGDYIKMIPTKTSFTVPSTLTGYSSDQTIDPSELYVWRVIKVNNDGTIDAVSQYVSSTDVYFKGLEGYMNSIGVLNYIAKQYENSKYTVGSRYMGYGGQIEYLTNTTYYTHPAPWTVSTSDNANEVLGGGDVLYQNDYNLVENALGTLAANKTGTTTASKYFLGSRYYMYGYSSTYAWTIRTIGTNGSLGYISVYAYYPDDSNIDPYSDYASLRPIITLKPEIKAESGNGSQGTPYVLS